jgi:hypothetical protein
VGFNQKKMGTISRKDFEPLQSISSFMKIL